MTIKQCVMPLIIVFLLTTSSLSRAVERLFWDKVPLRITLPVGSERLVTFPADVRVGMPGLLTDKLRTQSHQGTIYWKASDSFDTQRIEVREVHGNQIYLIDLKASKKTGSTTPIEVLDKHRGNKEQLTEAVRTDGKKSNRLGYIALTRYAAQQLYAPARLLKASTGIHRVSVARQPILHLIRGKTVVATPVAGWQSGTLYVTAVALKNTGSQPVILDPRDLRGTWRASTFQHSRLHPFGSEADVTAVYLISDRPFYEVM